MKFSLNKCELTRKSQLPQQLRITQLFTNLQCQKILKIHEFSFMFLQCFDDLFHELQFCFFLNERFLNGICMPVQLQLNSQRSVFFCAWVDSSGLCCLTQKINKRYRSKAKSKFYTETVNKYNPSKITCPTNNTLHIYIFKLNPKPINIYKDICQAKIYIEASVKN